MRILPPAMVLILLLVMVFFYKLLPGPLVVPDALRWMGVGLALLGLVINLTAALHFGRARTNIKTFDDPTLLVTDGLFRFSRNPMYLGFSAFLIGTGLAMGGLWPLLVAPVFTILADRWYIPFEELAMRRTFGGAYETYVGKTRRWL